MQVTAPELQPHSVLLTTDTVGGVWTCALDLARDLTARGVGVVLAVLGPPPTARHRADATAVPGLVLIETALPLDWLASKLRDVEEAAAALRELAFQSGVAIAHLHAPALVGRAPWPIPVVATAHSCTTTWWRAVRGGPLPTDLAWRAEATAAGMATATVVTAPSNSFAAQLAQAYGTGTRLVTVLNGRASITGIPAPPHAPVRTGALAAGRLWDAAKDIRTLDAAAAICPTPITAAGPARGPNGDDFVPENLTLLGDLTPHGLAHRMATSAVFVSTAVYEPFGLAVLEAAQQGTPLLLADTPTFRELWGGAAVLVPPRRPRLLASAIKRLSADVVLRERLGALARRRAARFTTDRMTADMCAVYRAALRTRCDLPPPSRPARAA